MLVSLFPRQARLPLRIAPVVALFLLLAWVLTHLQALRDGIRLNIPRYGDISNISANTTHPAGSQPVASKTAGSTAMSTAPVPTTISKVAVMAKVQKEDTTWTADLNGWDHAVYEVDNPKATLRVPLNKGKEAMTYLTYIIDHYDSLPSIIAFVHSHKDGWPQAWHTDTPGYSNAVSLNTLNIDFVQRNGYANLRCNGNPGCPAEIQLHRDKQDSSRTTENNMGTAWRAMFNSTPPDTIGVACCAQFAVSGKQVLERPRSDYEKYRHWLIETELDDDTSGRIFEYLWHIIFGREAVYCPALAQCYCDDYNRC
ncbi:hypothetical protein BU16DRAFT_600049 [Lophium mytilinum]|uniref:Uncharacterized protein n=1 Tax=Lophium mytilinum TaxID=390894 RepID=A0A6A6RB02_9PEZI|nr:hypothetical protein BU16DRAFT_600049 [Lophium mytilinum]